MTVTDDHTIQGEEDIVESLFSAEEFRRMTEAFKDFTHGLNTRIDDNIPEFASLLLGQLYPQFDRQIPSCAIAKCELSQSTALTHAGQTVPKGTILQTDDGLLRFQTTSGIIVWPITITSFSCEQIEDNGTTPWGLNIELTSALSFDKMSFEYLDIHICADLAISHELYAWIWSASAQIVIKNAEQSTNPNSEEITLPHQALQSTELNGDLLPEDPRVHKAYRLLLSYLALPQKFLFFRVAFQSPKWETKKITITIPIANNIDPYSIPLDSKMLQIGAVPIANLFPKTSEPIIWNQKQTEYNLIPDEKRHSSTEIYSVEYLSSPNKQIKYRSYFAPTGQESQITWIARRILSEYSDIAGSDIKISMHSQEVRDKDKELVIYGETICTNRGKADNLPANVELKFRSPITGVRIYTTMNSTKQKTPPTNESAQWDVISLLASKNIHEHLAKILKAHRFAAYDHRVIDSIKVCEYDTTIAIRHHKAYHALVPQITCKLKMRATPWNPLLFSRVINEFIHLTANFNMQTSTILLDQHDKVIHRWGSSSTIFQ